ncbi:MAG: NYN domain-containing protein, partial [Clostridia bacterium]|nr:NYN domain-containing protein [Clostridia bacterium]
NKRLFSKKEKRIVAFVDYEHWYISLDSMYNRQKPDLASWFADLSERGRVVDAIFFGDFSKGGMKSEISRIRLFTNKIIDTCNPNPKSNKDFTDFIILDNIYQRAMASDDIDMFVIFSGDGHFSSVAAFLKTNLNKEVGIYGIGGATSRQLRDTGDWYVEIPNGLTKPWLISQLVLRTVKKMEKDRMTLITEDSVIKTVSEEQKMSLADVRDAVLLLEKKNILRVDNLIINGAVNRTLKADWTLAANEGYKLEKS